MAIPFTCECGKKMSAKEEFAGRRLRCPECQRVVTIPKVGSAVVGAPVHSANRPAPSAPPTLTRSEVAAVVQQIRETPAPTNTTANDEPDFNELFGTGAPAAPARAPMAAPVAKPMAKPATAPVVPAVGAVPEVKAGHPWVDTSLQQNETPWQIGDRELYQDGISPAREWEFSANLLVGLAAIAGCLVVLYAPW